MLSSTFVVLMSLMAFIHVAQFAELTRKDREYLTKEELERRDDVESRSPIVFPEDNDGDICGQRPDFGWCWGYYPRLYFSVYSKQCEFFIYGGCGGNDNNFKTPNECKQACAGDFCQLSPEPGFCRSRFTQWFYNANTKQCETFIYGGCGGNANNFLNRLECQEACVKQDKCQLPSDTGPCRASFPKWFYNAASGQCERFIYGGCEGNANNFETQEDCKKSCGSASSGDLCQLPSDTGPCRASFPKWFFNAASEQCESFIYGGCEGNANNFETQEDCKKSCNSASSGDLCQLPSDTGPCRASFPKWFFNAASGQCESFIYGGCEGNANNFDTSADCKKACSAVLV